MKKKVILGIGIILITLYFGYAAVIESLTYYRGVDVVMANADYYSSHRVKMIGDIVNNTIKWTESGYQFEMSLNGSAINVSYTGPQNFPNSGRIVVIGRIDDGVFHATEMNVKCPTKYEPT
jgi:cytochrome c-type biogenesis protein CcmE